MSNRRRLGVDRERRRQSRLLRVSVPNMAGLILDIGNGALPESAARTAAAVIVSIVDEVADLTVDELIDAAAALAAHPVTARHLADVADLVDLGCAPDDVAAACARALVAVGVDPEGLGAA